jgi:hypothetical protein
MRKIRVRKTWSLRPVDDGCFNVVDEGPGKVEIPPPAKDLVNQVQDGCRRIQDEVNEHCRRALYRRLQDQAQERRVFF